MHARKVVGGHKKTGAAESDDAITFTANYIRDYETARKAAANADDFVSIMKAKYPAAAQDWILGLSAKRAFPKAS